jgi:hypothetical protein
MSIHDAILDHIQAGLQAALIDNLDANDPARAGLILQGRLQGEIKPDKARIVVELYENDPDGFVEAQGTTALTGAWTDEILLAECGLRWTWARRFTAKARCLLVQTKEDKAAARSIASTLRSRIEQTLMGLPFAGVQSGGEYVSKGIISPEALQGEMMQGGGPGSYDYFIKVRFQLETTVGVPQL